MKHVHDDRDAWIAQEAFPLSGKQPDWAAYPAPNLRRDEEVFITSRVIEKSTGLDVSNSRLLAGRAFEALQQTEPLPGTMSRPRPRSNGRLRRNP